MTEFPSLYIRSAGPGQLTDLDLGDVDLLPLKPLSLTLEMVGQDVAKATITLFVTPDVDVPAEVTFINAAPEPLPAALLEPDPGIVGPTASYRT